MLSLLNSSLHSYKVSRPNMIVMGYVALFGQPLYWALWTYVFPQQYDSAVLRFSGAAISLFTILSEYLPSRAKKYLPLHWFLCVMYNCSFLFTVLMIMNGYSKIYLVSEMMMLFIVAILIPNLLSNLLNLFLGSVLAVLYCKIFYPTTVLFTHDDWQYIPLFAFATLFGSSFVIGIIRGAALEQKKLLLKSIGASISKHVRTDSPLFKMRTLVDDLVNDANVSKIYSEEDIVRFVTTKLEGGLSDLNRAQEELIRSEKMKMDALNHAVARIAHELSTPIYLTKASAEGVQNQTEKLLRVLKSENSQALTATMTRHHTNIKELVDGLMVSVDRSTEIIHNFKELAEDQVVGKKKNFKLLTYIHTVLNTLRDSLVKRGIQVNVKGDDGALYHNQSVFYQIIQNLVCNALKHAYDKEGVIDITVKDKGGDVLLTVADYGKGIPKEQRDRIFDAFYTTGKDSGGMGLGLHIVYRIVNYQLKGHIRCESKEGKGTSFFLTIPKNGGRSLSSKTTVPA